MKKSAAIRYIVEIAKSAIARSALLLLLIVMIELEILTPELAESLIFRLGIG